jgi:hypothetical protein
MQTQTKAPYGKPKNKTAEEARRLSISEAMLLSLYNKGIIPGLRVSDRIILFDPELTDAALTARQPAAK